MRPHLSNVIYVPLVPLRISLRNQLDIHSPGRKVSLGYALVQVLTGEVGISASGSQRLLYSEVLDTLVGLVGVLHKEGLSLGIDPLEGVRTVPVHVTVTLRSASVRVHNGHGMDRLWVMTEEIPLSVRVEYVLHWVWLQRMEEIRCHHWVPKEEHREIDSNHVVVAFLSVELQGKAPDVSEQVGAAAWANRSGHPGEERRSLADLVEELGFAEGSHVSSNFEVAVDSVTLGMGCSLRNPLSVEFLDLVQEIEVLEKSWSTRTCC